MPRHLALALSVAALPALAQEPPRLPVAAPPVAVTIHPDQASVTREAAVDLPAGESLLVLPGIPAGVLRDSVTARGRAAALVELGAVELRQAGFDPRPAERRRAEAADRRRAIEDEIAAIDVRIAAWQAQLALIERLGAGFTDRERRPPAQGEAPRAAADPALWRQAWDAVRAGTEEAAEQMRALRLQKREAEARKSAVEAEIFALGAQPAGTFEIAVAVRAEQATRLELSVTYQLRGAAWQPVYAARLDTATGRLALRQEAIVTQRTGEDWEGVALALSTARPSAEARAPELRPWRITLADPEAEARRREAAMAMMQQETQRMRSAAPGAAPASPAPAPMRDVAAPAATLVASGFAVEYRLPGRASIRADGSERRLRIEDSEVEATMAVRAVPRLDPRGFLEARFPHPAPAPTLPGRAALYLDGVFVGSTALPLLRPQEEVRLAFGADDRIRIAYAPQAQRRGTEGSLLTGRTATRGAEALITLKSFHRRPMEVTVLDQVPVSGEDQLVVTPIAEPAPSARDIDNRPGVLAWTMTLAPGEERRIRVGWTVTSPRDREVFGLER